MSNNSQFIKIVGSVIVSIILFLISDHGLFAEQAFATEFGGQSEHNAADKLDNSEHQDKIKRHNDHDNNIIMKSNLNKLLGSASLKNGRILANKCAMCHTFDENGLNKIGPNLWNIVGDRKARDSKYQYSKALKLRSEETWTLSDLYNIINKPSVFIPGNKMTFAGINDPQEIADIIVFLRSLSNAPVPLS